MENQNKISKTILFLSVLSFVLFTGSYLTKINLIWQFFDAETIDLKSIYTGSDLSLVFKSLLPSFSITLISFFSFILFFAVYLIYSKINLKNNGWLFIILIILVVTTPFELYLFIKIDWKIIVELMKTNISQDFILSLLKKRLTILGPFPLILLFSYFVIIFLTVFKPFKNK